MERLFTFLQTYYGGILFLLFCLFCIAFLVQWFAWMFGKGRFRVVAADEKTGSGSTTRLRYLFSNAIVKIINDFRHLLASAIILIFALALLYSLWKAGSLSVGADSASVINNMKEALQTVVATLGGLVGSIIGYYFGESSAAKGPDLRAQPPAPDTSPIKPVTPPAQAALAENVEDT